MRTNSFLDLSGQTRLFPLFQSELDLVKAIDEEDDNSHSY